MTVYTSFDEIPRGHYDRNRQKAHGFSRGMNSVVVSPQSIYAIKLTE